jgi:hypothetical protein
MHPPFTYRFVMIGVRKDSVNRSLLIRYFDGEDM